VAGGAQAAYRGYRRQALYTLHRMLRISQSSGEVYQPEGHEDLGIYRDGNLVEVVQVKDHKQPLSLSTFHPGKEDSFFNRVARLLHEHPQVRVIVVTYGHVGDELLAACSSAGDERERVATKLATYGFLTETQAGAVLERLEFSLVDQTTLESEIIKHLRKSVTVADYYAAFDLLTYWLFKCSEETRLVTQEALRDILNQVGRFVAQREAHHSEWFTSIQPIQDRPLTSSEERNLSAEFFSGVATRYDHVLAGLDILRPTVMESILGAFSRARVVIIHGASGQGKSTVAYRFLREYFPALWRFEITSIGDRAHALRIATALSEQAESLSIPLAVYVDVRPKDEGWEDLVRQLSTHKNVFVLVTVREEDWRRASLPSYEVPYEVVEVLLSENEAQYLYSAFSHQGSIHNFTHFEEAWDRFGGRGPLLEFVHLITQGDSLGERLEGQVARLRDDVRCGRLGPNELELVRLVSIASAYSTSLNVKDLALHLGLVDPIRTLHHFEKEYLVRLSDDKTGVEGLHPVRGKLLADCLTDEVFSPWVDGAKQCIALAVDSDLGTFLMHAFADRTDESNDLITPLFSVSPTTWVGVEGVTRAFLWMGLRKYVDVNLPLFREIYERCGTGWAAIIDFDVADAIPGAANGMLETVCNLAGEPGASEMRQFRSRQTDKVHVFTLCQQWLSEAVFGPRNPASESEWRALAYVAFWSNRLDVHHVKERISRIDLASLEGVPLSVAANVLFATHQCANPSWEPARNSTVSRFREELGVITLEDDGQRVRAHYVVDPAVKPAPETKTVESPQQSIHDGAIAIVDFLRRLWPDRTVFACQAYGCYEDQFRPEHDETRKEIPVRSLPDGHLTEVNANLRGLVELSFRPSDWITYTSEVLRLRTSLIEVLTPIREYLLHYFHTRTAVSPKELLSVETWKTCNEGLVHRPHLPLPVCDPWGLATESTSPQTRDNTSFTVPKYLLSLRRFMPWLKAQSDYFGPASNFLDQAPHALVLQSALGRRGVNTTEKRILDAATEGGIKPNLARLSMMNLSNGYKALPKMQVSFRKVFEQMVDASVLGTLEQEEVAVWDDFLQLWSFFTRSPSKQWNDPVRKAKSEIRSADNHLWTRFEKTMRHVAGKLATVRNRDTIVWGGKRALLIVIDFQTVFDGILSFERVVRALRSGLVGTDDSIKLYREAVWEEVVILPIVRGRALRRQVWQVPFGMIQGVEDVTKLFWWSMPKPVTPEAWNSLGIDSYSHATLPQTEAFLESFGKLQTLVGYHADIWRLDGILNDESTPVLQARLQPSLAELAPALTQFLQFLGTLCERVALLEPEELHERPYLLTIADMLSDLKPQLIPEWARIQKVPSIRELARWYETLVSIQISIVKVFLCWNADILEHPNWWAQESALRD
jgi:hypothetical protein